MALAAAAPPTCGVLLLARGHRLGEGGTNGWERQHLAMPGMRGRGATSPLPAAARRRMGRDERRVFLFSADDATEWRRGR